jgi:hypothetical protein
MPLFSNVNDRIKLPFAHPKQRTTIKLGVSTHPVTC